MGLGNITLIEEIRSKLKLKLSNEILTPQRKKAKELVPDQEDKDTRKKCYLIFALFTTISNSLETWLVDNSASKHMTGYRSALADLKGKRSFVKVELGDDTTYEI